MVDACVKLRGEVEKTARSDNSQYSRHDRIAKVMPRAVDVGKVNRIGCGHIHRVGGREVQRVGIDIVLLLLLHEGPVGRLWREGLLLQELRPLGCAQRPLLWLKVPILGRSRRRQALRVHRRLRITMWRRNRWVSHRARGICKAYGRGWWDTKRGGVHRTSESTIRRLAVRVREPEISELD